MNVMTGPTPIPMIVPLPSARAGQWACVDRIIGGWGAAARLTHLGVMPGHLLRMVRPSARGPVLIEVKGARLALGQRLARSVLVRLTGPAAASEASAIPAE